MDDSTLYLEFGIRPLKRTRKTRSDYREAAKTHVPKTRRGRFTVVDDSPRTNPLHNDSSHNGGTLVSVYRDNSQSHNDLHSARAKKAFDLERYQAYEKDFASRVFAAKSRTTTKK